MLSYETIHGKRVPLDQLDAEEQRTFDRLYRYALGNPDWNEFCNRLWREVQKCYLPRGLSPRQITRRLLYQVAQDMESRLGIAQGRVRESEYRDELASLIQQAGLTRYRLSQRTGVSQDLLSHVLKGRKDLSLKSLKKLLDALGYRIAFTRKPRGLSVEDAVIDEPQPLPTRRNGAVRRVRRRVSA
ncbi:MAG TPA: helix-turn-helix domain-containing protein [Phycisphaerae bacterium]|jgi:hypothetical protein